MREANSQIGYLHQEKTLRTLWTCDEKVTIGICVNRKVLREAGQRKTVRDYTERFGIIMAWRIISIRNDS